MKNRITFKAAVKGNATLLVPLIKLVDSKYAVAGIEYGQADGGVSTVVCTLDAANECQALQELIEIVAVDLHISTITVLDWTGKTRPIAHARDAIAFILWKRYGFSFPKIAELMGAKSHASALLASRKFPTEKNLKMCSLVEAYTTCKKCYTPIKKDVKDESTTTKED